MIAHSWTLTTLGEQLTFQRGFDITKKDQEDGKYPVVSSSGPNSTHKEFKVAGPGVVIGRKGTLGTVFYVQTDFWPHDTTLWVKDFHGNHPKYAYYFLKTMGFEKYDCGASNPTLNRNHIHTIPITYPPPTTQGKIAAILSAYDDLIENNTRRIAIMEEMAQAIYREWFVNFRFPGHEKVKMVDSALGKVPQGWEDTPLKSMVSVKHGYAFQGDHFSVTPTERVLTTPGNFRPGGGFQIGRQKYYQDTGPLDVNYVLAPMDLIVTMTDLSKESDTLGYPALVPRTNGITYLHNQRIGKVIPSGELFHRFFLYCLMRDEPYRHHVVGAATGLSVKHTSPNRIVSFSTLLPKTQSLLLDFENVAVPLFQQISCLSLVGENLRATRDLLLPKLISGQLDVEGLDIETCEELVEAAISTP